MAEETKETSNIDNDNNSNSSKQYALLPQCEPVQIISTEKRSVKEELLEIFEGYANLYPNPALALERQERDRLLRAISAADHAVQLNPPKKKKKGLFGSLFGKDDDETAATALANDEGDEDDRLKYTDLDNSDDAWLLGTEVSLDTSNIPEEAHAVARYSLCHKQGPNVARTSWETAGSSCIVIVDLGVVVEYKPGSKKHKQGLVEFTSDRQQLLQSQNEQERKYNPATARAAIIGPNLLIVAWGVSPAVKFYRRLTVETKAKVQIHWEAVAVLGPTPAVEESLGDLFLEEDGGETALLTVTDIVPLVVEFSDQAPAASLAIARLGGFLEIVPLPPQMWYGPEIAGRKSRNASLPDLANTPSVIAMTTSEYHTDVVGLEAFRTSVADNVEWNQDLYPNAPPAEHVLAAYGSHPDHREKQVVTFWSVATILGDEDKTVGFTIHINLTEAMDLGLLGPDITVFASQNIMRHWRRPRQVELRDPNDNENISSQPRVTTISVPAPVIDFRFMVNTKTWSIRAAVLDWNGGVMLLDCDFLEKAVSQRLSEFEYSYFYRDQQVAPLVSIIHSRADGRRQFFNETDDGIVPLPSVHSLQWFPTGNQVDDDLLGDVALTVFMDKPSELRLLFSSTFAGSGNLQETQQEDPISETAIVPCSQCQVGTLHRFGGSRYKALYLAFHSTDAVKKETLLNFCALQELRPGDIVQSLVQAGQFRQAIAAAESLSPADQVSIADIIEKCKKRLWESELDLSTLESMRDDAFVLKQTLCGKNAPEQSAVLNGDVALYRSVCRLALDRIQSARLSSSLAIFGSVEERETVNEELHSCLIKNGTYELLCAVLGQATSVEHFLGEFLSVSLLDLAVGFAKKADITCLSLICLRHWNETKSEILTILDELPITIDPRLYMHLLPVIRENNGPVATEFLAAADLDYILDYTCMPEYLERRFGVTTCVDEEDLALVLEKISSASTTKTDNDINMSAIASWLEKRALDMESMVSTSSFSSIFSKLALCALHIDPTVDNFCLSSVPLNVQKLFRQARFSETICSVQIDVRNNRLVDSLSTLDLEGFAAMEIEDLVSLIMSCGEDPTDEGLSNQYKKYLLPLLREKLSDKSECDFQQEIDNAMRLFCTHLLQEVGTDSGQLINAIEVCSRIHWLSRTCVEKGSRIIQDKSILVELALFSTDRIVELSNAAQLTSLQQEIVVAGLWRIYESVPLRVPPEQDKGDVLCNMLQVFDDYYKELILLDILVRWPGENIFTISCKRPTIEKGKDGFNPAVRLRTGESAVSYLCNSFCTQIASTNTHSRPEVSTLLAALLKDINEINRLCFDDLLPLKEILNKFLFKPLLEQHEISLLQEFLSLADQKMIDSEGISREVSLFFNDVVYGSGVGENGSSSLHAAIECQDLLGKWLPELHREFLSARRYLDAAHLINSVLLADCEEKIQPANIKAMLPLDVIDFVLEKNPSAFIIDCQDWSDSAWAKQANSMIRHHLERSASKNPDDDYVPDLAKLPPLPGKPVFQLAQILDLEDISSVITVKTRVIHFALDGNLFGPAAAVCRSLVGDVLAAKVDAALALQAIESLVVEELFDDLATKKELCSVAIIQLSTNFPLSRVDSYETILRSWSTFERVDVPKSQQLNRPLSSISRLQMDTFKEYSTDISNLFATLKMQFSDCVVDDALLNALARFLIFWCIGRSTRPQENPVKPFDASSTASVIELAASILLHVQDENTSSMAVREYLDIFNKQRNHALQRRSQSSQKQIQPDPEIVAGLHGRGYSENGAKRAALMTANRGFNEALQYCVSHSLDPGFDDPLVYLRTKSGAFFDDGSAENLGVVLSSFREFRSRLAILDQCAVKSDSHIDAQNILKTHTAQQNAESVERSLQPKGTDQASHASEEIRGSVGTESVAPERSSEAAVASNAPSKVLPPSPEDLQARTDPDLENEGWDWNDDNDEIEVNGITKENSDDNRDNKQDDGLSLTQSSPKVMGTFEDVKSERNESQGETNGIGKLSSNIKPKHLGPDLSPQNDSSKLLGTPSEPPKNVEPHTTEKSPFSPSAAGAEISVANDVTKNQRSIIVDRVVDKQKGSPMKIIVPGASPIAKASNASGPERSVAPMRQRMAETSVMNSVATASPQDRSALLNLGQAAFRSARAAASPSNQESRRRLIEEGRQLLERARSNSADPTKRFFSSRERPPRATPTFSSRERPSRATPTAVTMDNKTLAAESSRTEKTSTGNNEPAAMSDPKTSDKASSQDEDAWDFDEEDLEL